MHLHLHLHIPLTVHHLTFHCRSQEPILWHLFKAARRGARSLVLAGNRSEKLAMDNQPT